MQQTESNLESQPHFNSIIQSRRSCLFL